MLRIWYTEDRADMNWLETLVSAHSKDVASRQAGLLAKKLDRISTAVQDSMRLNNPLALLQLPKKERTLVESIVNSRAETSEK